jgi:hypothetical protein
MDVDCSKSHFNSANNHVAPAWHKQASRFLSDHMTGPFFHVIRQLPGELYYPLISCQATDSKSRDHICFGIVNRTVIIQETQTPC